MPWIVGVRFRPVTKVYYFDPNNIDGLEPDTRVIVETSRGVELGVVAQAVHEVPDEEIKGPLKRVIRLATTIDLMLVEQYRLQEQAARAQCEALVKELNVPIKLTDAEYSFDGSRLTFAFTAEQRVDFRDLVKALGRTLQTRIEMKQVGARDETKLLDGYGRCGRQLCCSSWLTEFHPVSIKMAKNQSLPLAPNEISGLCGRLLCCLAYENDLYSELRESLPRVGTHVKTPQGTTGFVRGLNIIQERVLVRLEEEEEQYLEFDVSEIELVSRRETAPVVATEEPAAAKASKRKRKRRKKKPEDASGDEG
jgi:cell fate regulator YaaT (PSP1 superfamily)